MKTRTDFVSNSSSCSFIIAVNSTYDIESLAKDIAAATVNKKSEWHDPKLKSRNENILKFCMSTNQLAWLGGVVIGKEVRTYTLDTFIDLYDGNSSEECMEMAKSAWNDEVKHVKKATKSPKKCADWELKEYGNSKYDEDKDEITRDEDICIYAPVISNHDMEYEYSHGIFEVHEASTNDKHALESRRVNHIVKTAKKLWRSKGIDVQRPDIYQITKHTIENTRSLIAAGYKIDFDEVGINKNIDELEQMIDAGDKIFYIRQAYSGDGYGETYIYCEDEAKGISEVQGIETIGGELC